MGALALSEGNRFLASKDVRPGKLRAAPSTRPLPDLARYVDPFVGTAGAGNTWPGSTTPFGMMQWSPDTAPNGVHRPGGYSYRDRVITGFSLTHLSGAGCFAYGDVPLMPTVRPLTVSPGYRWMAYAARFSHSQEQAAPGSYGVHLRSNIRVQLATTTRSGIATFTFPRSARATLLINADHSAVGNRDGMVRLLDSRTVIGFSIGGRFCNHGLAAGYTVYFAIVVNRPFAAFGTWSGRALRPQSRASGGRYAGAYVRFDTRRERTVLVKVGISFVSAQNALRNIRAEDLGWRLKTVQLRARDAWNRLLNRVGARGGSDRERRIFYTALYHALLHPNVFSDADGRYRGFDGRVHRAEGYTQYANFSLWDMYRAQAPLLAVLAPKQLGDMMQSLLADGEQGGQLPRWPLANADTGVMDGDPADAVIAEAYAFGVRRFDARAALSAMIRGATEPASRSQIAAERPYLSDYLARGYVPATVLGGAAMTLEYAIDDFAVGQMTRAFRGSSESGRLMRRAANWRHLFDSSVKLVLPRLATGRFTPGAGPADQRGFVEGNAAQYTWMVPQDIRGLILALGGTKATVTRLDAFFARLNAGPASPHEWIGNEIGFGTPWVYDFAGAWARTQMVVRRILRRDFGLRPNGLPGNDDLGALSSWYVWAALGLYPEIPGLGGFAIGCPAFPAMSVALPGAGALNLHGPPGTANRSVARVLYVNGRVYDATWLPWRAVDHGGSLDFGTRQPGGAR